MAVMAGFASTPKASYDVLRLECVTEKHVQELHQQVAALRDEARQASDVAARSGAMAASQETLQRRIRDLETLLKQESTAAAELRTEVAALAAKEHAAARLQAQVRQLQKHNADLLDKVQPYVRGPSAAPYAPSHGGAFDR